MALITDVSTGSVLTATTFNALPRGLTVAAGASASNQTGITAAVDLTNVSVTFTAVANRYYVAVLVVSFVSTAGSPAYQQSNILNGATNLGQTLTAWTIGANTVHAVVVAKPFTLSAGSQTIKASFGRAGGDAATYTANSGSWIAVLDMGNT